MGFDSPKESAGSSSTSSDSYPSAYISLDRLISSPEMDELGYNALHHIVKHYASANDPLSLVPTVLPQEIPTISTNSENHAPSTICPTQSMNRDTTTTRPKQHHLNTLLLQTALQTPHGQETCLQTTHDGSFTPLHLCCRSMHTVPDAITETIAQANIDAIRMQDDEGDTPLHAAFRYGASEEIIRVLIELKYGRCHFGNEEEESEEMPIDDNEECEEEENSCAFLKYNEDGETPLHTAISHEASANSIQLLLDACPHSIFHPTLQLDSYQNYVFQSGNETMSPTLKTPLHMAAEYGRYDVLQVMVKSHAAMDCVEALLRMRDENDVTPITILWNQICDFMVYVGNEKEDSDDVDMDNNVDSRNDISTSNHGGVNFDATLCEEILECIALLIQSCHPTEEPQDTSSQDAPTHEMYQLLKTSISLGSQVVPQGYVSFLTKHHPGILRCKDAKGRLPLHLAAIHHDEDPSDTPSCPNKRPEHSNDTHYHSTNGVWKTFDALDYPMQDKPCSPQQPQEKVPPSPQSKTKTIFITLLQEYPSAAYQKDNSGRLPLHYAIPSGLSYPEEISKVLRIHPSSIGTPDPSTGLVPFMAAGAHGQSVDMIFQLLQCSPDLITRGNGDRDSQKGKRRSNNASCSKKRQRTR